MTAAAEPRGIGRAEQATRIGLVIALVCLLVPAVPAPFAVLAAIVIVGLLVASVRWPLGRLAILALLAVGVGLLLAPTGSSSDVLAVTQAAIRQMLAGSSPYGHGFDASVPPGAPFPYGPVALAWYLPALEAPGTMERLATAVVLVALAVRGRPVGLAVYATMPALVVSVNDGANDHSVGLLLLVALLAALRWPVAGAIVLALVAAFKPYALAWLPGLVVYAGGLAPLVAFGLASVAIWVVPTLVWGAEAILWSLRQADALHARPYYSLAYALGGDVLPQPAWQGLRFAAGVIVAVLGMLRVRSAASFILVGTLVFAVTLFLGWWSTFAYFAAVAPVLCWHLDDWLGLGAGRVAWPGDPVGRLTTWIDRRWPIRRPDQPPAVTEPSPLPA